MNSKYKSIEFPELQDINNFEYHKVYLKLEMMEIIKLLKRVIPKLIKIYKSKVVK